jgi:hypothetical protein
MESSAHQLLTSLPRAVPANPLLSSHHRIKPIATVVRNLRSVNLLHQTDCFKKKDSKMTRNSLKMWQLSILLTSQRMQLSTLLLNPSLHLSDTTRIRPLSTLSLKVLTPPLEERYLHYQDLQEQTTAPTTIY